MRMEVETARTVKCVKTGAELAYRGYGRPPKYTAEVRKAVEQKRRRARYLAAKKAKAEANARKAARRGRPRAKAA